MNDMIIKKLAEKAGFFYWENESWGPGPNFIDWSCVYDKEFAKYTELIVRECANVGALGQSCTDRDLIIRGVLAHFGIKDEV
jgi:hypothetical protein